jgi:hypothetical protein
MQGNADGAGTQTAPILPHPLSYRPAMMSACSSSVTSVPGAANVGLAGIASISMPWSSAAARHDVEHLGQPKSGLCRLMDAVCGSVSLGRMTNLDRRDIDPPIRGIAYQARLGRRSGPCRAEDSSDAVWLMSIPSAWKHQTEPCGCTELSAMSRAVLSWSRSTGGLT